MSCQILVIFYIFQVKHAVKWQRFILYSSNEKIHKYEISKMQTMISTISNGILALLDNDEYMIGTLINEINTTNKIDNKWGGR